MKDELLALLREEEGFFSGAELGRRLGVSRAAVWKAIKGLEEEGYEIEAVTNKGYRLLSVGDIENEAEIQYDLKTSILGRKIVCFQKTTSTNDEIRKLAYENAPEGTLAVAEIQTDGRGRRGRAWHTAPGGGIWMSLLLRPDIPPEKATQLTLIAGLAVCQAIRKKTGLDAGVKWPNDIMVHGKKLCGISTELSGEMERIYFIILGIGINVGASAFPPELEHIATSIKTAGGSVIRRAELIQEVLWELENRYIPYVSGRGLAQFLEEFRSLCVTLGKKVQVLQKEPFTGTAIDITENGELLVEKENGERVVVLSGEVSIRSTEKECEK